jgi:predicted nucleic acid-binding protein
MEALDVEQEHAWFLTRLQAGEHTERLLARRRRRDLTLDELRDVFRRFMTTLVERDLERHIQWIPLTLRGKELDEAMVLAGESNISAPDCLHVATALQAGCDVLVTSDDGLRDAARPHIPAVKPEELLAAIHAKRE